ncbi:MAG TPA: TIGR03085 family protein [Actinobacteria bacterium]|nr:TIGR03085 family protein [Actinomycetota bacterium]
MTSQSPNPPARDDKAGHPQNYWAQSERAGLCDALERLGPQAPTLCEGWTAKDLAGHLIVREGRPDAAIGIMIPAARGYTARAQDKATQRPWSDVIMRIRSGPPRGSMMRLTKVDALANTIEYLVHHEDLLRAQPGWQPRNVDAEFENDLWAKLHQFAPRLMKSSPVAIDLVRANGDRLHAAQGTPGAGTVTITGSVIDLVMLAYGRHEHRAEFSGAQADVAAVKSASFGI